MATLASLPTVSGSQFHRRKASNKMSGLLNGDGTNSLAGRLRIVATLRRSGLPTGNLFWWALFQEEFYGERRAMPESSGPCLKPVKSKCRGRLPQTENGWL